ncbi:MAG: hypothetical protein M1814_001914 [Vezdaea aestivalis]|nr:MAG: hypothetical protein M1814_001914 [Vezdaea aestivalis]
MDALTEDSRLANPKKDLEEIITNLPDYLGHNGPSTKAGDTALFVRLLKLLEYFQEWPQLLDSSLSTFSSLLIASLKTSISVGFQLEKDLHTPTAVRTGLSKLLYTLCKVRGWRVISNFLPNEPKYLEPVVEYFEAGDATMTFGWEERYILLLWMSHLMLTPFDLASMASSEGMPIVRRLLSCAQAYIGSPGKEREAAAILLARLALRPDVESERLLHKSIGRVLADFEKGADQLNVYHFVGRLSFFTHILSGANFEDIKAYLEPIFSTMTDIRNGITPLERHVNGSALSRKIIIKIIRECTLLILKQSSTIADTSDNMLDEAVDQCLTALGDADTSVRYAASKALAAIVFELDSDMAAEVIEALLSSFEEDIRWEKPNSWPDGRTKTGFEDAPKNADFTFVSPLRWHGLTLALAQLLFKRSPPPEKLPSIIDALILALSFQQRTSTGALLGTNVRDVACFGIWSLSRKYTTSELLSVKMDFGGRYDKDVSIIKRLASELIVTATFDPIANIRRGASGALQELVGRHPDAIEAGIGLVQVIDYTEVGLRSRAINQVAKKVVPMSTKYADCICDRGILSWRGLAASDVESRRLVADFTGKIVMIYEDKASLRQLCIENRSNWRSSSKVLKILETYFHGLPDSDFEQRHGALMAIGSLLSQSDIGEDGKGVFNLDSIIDNFPSKKIHSQSYQDLMAESFSVLISAAFHLGNTTISRSTTQRILKTILPFAISRQSPVVVTAAAAATEAVFRTLSSSEQLASISTLTSHPPTPTNPQLGTIASLAKVYTFLDSSETLTAYLSLAAVSPSPITSRTAAFGALISILPTFPDPDSLTPTLLAGLNDYTVTPRGDEGSLVRLAAISAVSSLPSTPAQPLLDALLRLSVEKLDKLRPLAYNVLKPHLGLPELPTSPKAYFVGLLVLLPASPLLLGLSHILTTGPILPLRASRAALFEALIERPADQTSFLLALSSLLKSNHSSRHTVPLLKTITLILDADVLSLDTLKEFQGWRAIFVAIVASHFKVRVVAKVAAAVGAYAALARVMPPGKTRDEVKVRLAGMLGHGLKGVRAEAAVVIWGLENVGGKAKKLLEEQDWAEMEAEELKRAVELVETEMTS